jgi:hypothetical protein
MIKLYSPFIGPSHDHCPRLLREETELKDGDPGHPGSYLEQVVKWMCMQMKLSTQAKNAAGFHLAGYLHYVADGGGGATPTGCILILLS